MQTFQPDQTSLEGPNSLFFKGVGGHANPMDTSLWSFYGRTVKEYNLIRFCSDIGYSPFAAWNEASQTWYTSFRGWKASFPVENQTKISTESAASLRTYVCLCLHFTPFRFSKRKQ